MREKITALSKSLQAVELLKDEVIQMQSVDFEKYAAIIVSLQMKNEYYSLIKHFDDETFEQLTTRFSGNKDDAEKEYDMTHFVYCGGDSDFPSYRSYAKIAVDLYKMQSERQSTGRRHSDSK